MRFFTRLNIKGELFSSTFTYGLTAVIKLGSSLVLTRLLSPEAYGIFGILFSVLFMLELMSDVGSTALLIRHPRGGEIRFVHTVWTVRLIRSVLNFSIVFLGAPLIAAIYQTPVLTSAFRTLSVYFLLMGGESMAFILAQRDQRARISNYAELITNTIMTVFVIVIATLLKSHFALIYGALLQRGLMMVASHFFYRDIGVGIAFDREAIADQFKFARFVLPSSLLTIVLSQYDKVILLKLFDLSLLGIYGLAGNMLGPVTGVNFHNARVVLYARCAEYFRTDRSTARKRYYTENRKLLMLSVALPAILAGFSHAIVAILYDARYEMVGTVLMITGLAAIVIAFQNASENLLVAFGRTHMVLAANIFRLFTMIPASLLGYHWFGFQGFLWFNLIAQIPLVGYFFLEQRRDGLLDLRDEAQRFGAALAIFFACFAAGHVLLATIPPAWLHVGLKRH